MESNQIGRVWLRGVSLIALGLALGLGAMLLGLQAIPAIYRVSSFVRVDLPLDVQTDPQTGTSLLSREAVLKAAASEAQSPDVLALAAGKTEGLSAQRISAAVTVSLVPDTTLLEMQAQASSATDAAQIANALADALVSHAATALQQENQARERPLRSELATTQASIDTLKTQIASLLQQGLGPDAPAVLALQTQLTTQLDKYTTLSGDLVQLQFSEAAHAPALHPAQRAETSDATQEPSPTKLLAIAGMGGAAAGAVLAVMVERRGRKVRRARDAAALAPDLAICELPYIPSQRDSVLRLGEGSPGASALGALRMDLSLLASARTLRLLLITSERQGAGGSFVAATLAELWAQSGKRVLLVDAHLSAPTLDRRYGLRDAPGLTEALDAASTSEGDLNAYLTPAPIPYLMLLPAGRPPSSQLQLQLLSSQAFGRVLDALLLSEAEVIVVDVPPLSAQAAHALIAARADGVVLVADASRSTTRTLGQAIAALRDADAELVALVVNAPRGRRSEGVKGRPQPALVH